MVVFASTFLPRFVMGSQFQKYFIEAVINRYENSHTAATHIGA